MEGRHDVRIELNYDDGLRAKVLMTGVLPAELELAMERFGTVQWLPAVETLPVLLDALEAVGVKPQLSLEAEALHALSGALVDQDDAIGRWVSGEDGPALPQVREQLKPHQLQGAAFLVARGRALLADPRSLEPTATVVAAAEIVRAQNPGARVVIVSPESRHAEWQREVERLSGQTATVVTGVRTRRREIFAERSPYLLLSAEELPKERPELEAYAPDVLVVDEITRIWELGSKQLDALRRLKADRLFLLASSDVARHPEELHGVLSLLSPVLAGPRQTWEARYIDRSTRGQRRIAHEGELRGRIAPLVLQRSPESVGERGTGLREVRRVSLGRAQQTVYDRSLRTLQSLLGRGGLKVLEQRRAEDMLATMREVSDSMALRHEKQDESTKLEELRFILEEEAAAGRKVVVFCRWEAMTRQIADALKQRKVNPIRHYRKLPIKRREGLLERFRDDPEERVLLTTDTDLLVSPVKADVLVHFDVPWDPAVVTWRRAQVAGDVEEIALVAAGTIEEELWGLPKPATVASDLTMEEEEAGIAGVHLYGRQSSNLIRLKQLLGMEPLAEMIEEDEENPAMASVIASAIEAHREEEAAAAGGAQSGSEVSEDSSAASESAVEVEAVLEAASETAPTVTAGAAVGAAAEASEAAADEPTAEASEAAVDEPTAEASEAAADETAGGATAVETMADAVKDEAAAEAAQVGQDEAAADRDVSEHGGGPVDAVLDQLEIPLKAVNRILAGIPVIGPPISMINGVVWEMLASRLRRH